MQLKEIDYILKLNEYRNITKAAEALYISQPTLSIFLNNLEKELKVTLFKRNGRTLVPTYAGECYINASKEIMLKKWELDDVLNNIKSMDGGVLRVGLSLKHFSLLLPSVINSFNEVFPNIQLVLEDGHLGDLEKKLLNNNLDIILVNHIQSNLHMEYLPIYDDKLVLAVPTNHEACSYAKEIPNEKLPWIDISLFKEDRFILQNTNQMIRKFAEDAFAYGQIEPKSTFIISNIEAGTLLAGEGFGVAFNMKSYIISHKECENVRYFMVGDPKQNITLSAAYRKGYIFNEGQKEFIRLIQEKGKNIGEIY